MAYPTEAKNVRATYRFYPSRVRFVGTIPHGKSTREVAIDIDPDLIVRIAAALRATDGGRRCHWMDGAGPLHRDPYGYIGHAMWHVENPDQPMPCIDHSKVIDMVSLPAGNAPGDDS
jgi:hypothetical protein